MSNFNKGDTVCAVFLDLSKAFDSVDKKNLTKEIGMIWCKGNLHLLFCSYVDGRKQFVCFGWYDSNCEKK